MSETRDNAYKNLVNSTRLSESQQLVYNTIASAKQLSRQDLSIDTNMPINSVCGRVKELIDYGLIIVDGQKDGQELLRLRDDNDQIVKKDCLTNTKFEHLLKKITDNMGIANDFQKKKIKELVDRLS